MDCPVNEILSDKISKLNYTFIPPGFQGDAHRIRAMQLSLQKIVDLLGRQSTIAQGVNRIITTAEKLRKSPDHILYLLKDDKANGGKGDVIGMLKVGKKHLFLHNDQNKVLEVEPLCVLDFFVVGDRQRHGYGKILFDHMLQDLNTIPQQLAVDGPSPKLEQFLKKNYGVERLILHSNNFAVSQDFFKHVSEINKSGCSTPVVPTAIGRFAAHKPVSAIAKVIHGGSTYSNSSGRETSSTASPDADRALLPKGDATKTDSDSEPDTINEPPQSKTPNSDDVKSNTEEQANVHKSPERPSTLRVEPISETPAPVLSLAGSTTSRCEAQLTDRGYFDVKFYHNKLW